MENLTTVESVTPDESEIQQSRRIAKLETCRFQRSKSLTISKTVQRDGLKAGNLLPVSIHKKNTPPDV